jgi:hypothetical protein
MLAPLGTAERTAKGAMINYKEKQEEIRRKEEMRLQAEADALARKKEEQLRKKAEKLKTPELREQRLEEAEEVEAPVISVAPNVERVEGISVRKKWKAKVIDKKKFIEASLEHPNLLAFIQIDEPGLNKMAQATKGQVEYPGVSFFEESIMSSRSK